MSITVQYKLDDSEIVSAIKHITSIKQRQASLFGYYGGSAALLLLSGIQLLQGAGIVLAAFAVGVFALWPVRLRRILEVFRPLMALQTKVTVDGNGWQFEDAARAATWKWSAFQKLMTTDEFWLLFVAPRTALIVPKRPFTAEQRTEVEALIAKC